MNDYYDRPTVREMNIATGMEDELAAIRDVALALENLEKAARVRILRYVVDRFDIEQVEIFGVSRY